MSWDGKLTGSMAERASKPNPNAKGASDYDKQFKASAGKDLPPLALHHVTDWAKLREVWNRMVDDSHWGTICCWLYAAGFDVNNIYYETKLAQSPAVIVNAMIRAGDVAEVADPDEIHQRLTWSSWNLVEGPKESLRTDDRGNFHDIFSNVHGLSVDERANMRLADTIYTVMAGLNCKEPIAKERAMELSRALLAVNRNAVVIKFKPEMWIETAKKWRKNTM